MDKGEPVARLVGDTEGEEVGEGEVTKLGDKEPYKDRVGATDSVESPQGEPLGGCVEECVGVGVKVMVAVPVEEEHRVVEGEVEKVTVPVREGFAGVAEMEVVTVRVPEMVPGKGVEEREGEPVVEGEAGTDRVGDLLGGWLTEGVALAVSVTEGEGVVEGVAWCTGLTLTATTLMEGV